MSGARSSRGESIRRARLLTAHRAGRSVGRRGWGGRRGCSWRWGGSRGRVAVAVGVGAVGVVAAALRMRSISWSPDRHGAAGLDHFSMPGGLSVFAALAGSVRATDPSSAMNSSASPLSEALGLSVSVIVPLLLQ